MPGILGIPGIKGVGRVGPLLNYQPETKAYVSGLVTPISTSQKKKIDKLVKDLKTGLGITNLSDFFDTFYVLANETSESSLRNLAKRSQDATAVNSPAFTALEGFIGNGVSSYINSNYNASIGSNYKQNHCSFGVYSRTDSPIPSNDIGVSDGVTGATIGMNSSGSNQSRCQTGPGGTTAVSSSLGTHIVSRLESSKYIDYRNKIALNESLITSAAVVNLTWFILCRSTSGTPTLFNNRQISIAFAGKGMTKAQSDATTDAIESYMDSNGKGVIA